MSAHLSLSHRLSPPLSFRRAKQKSAGLPTDGAAPVKAPLPPTGLTTTPSSPLPTGGLASRALTLLSTTVASALQASVHSFLRSSITVGSLTLAHAPPDAAAYTFGQPPAVAAAAGAPVATLTLLHPPACYARIASAADIGFAEAYMAAEVVGGAAPGVDDADALLAALRVLIANRDGGALSPGRLVLSRLTSRVAGLVHLVGRRNSLAGSARNVAAHYDLSNALFATFLGPSWTYSCGLWRDPSPTAAAAAATAAAAASRWALPAGLTPGVVALNVGLVVWSGLFVSATTTWLQTAGQRVVPASEAAIIYATQPLWASLFAAAVLGESFGGRGIAGGLLILVGVVLAGRRPPAVGVAPEGEGGERGGGGKPAAPTAPTVAP